MRRCRPLLGTFVEIEAGDSAAIDAAFAVVERVHELMSAHDPASELSRINRFAHLAPVQVSEWTAAVIERALHWSRVSAGRFDAVRAGADWTAVRLAAGAVSLDGPARLDLGGIAKGFAVDRAVDALKAAGVGRGLVNAGGDLRGFGSKPWPITIVDPASRRPLVSVDLIDASMATSGGVPDESGALSFGHLPSRNRRWVSVTVRAIDACDADALTKIVWAGGSGVSSLLHSAGAEAFAIRADGRLESIGAEALAV